MSKRILVASTIGAVAKNLGQLCEKHGGQVSYFDQGKSLLKQLIEGKYELLLVELNFIEGEHRDLVSRIRSQKLQDLFVVVYAPAEINKNEQTAVNGVNSILTAPFSDSKILSLFKSFFTSKAMSFRELFYSGRIYRCITKHGV